jgi:regulator of sigma E protease
MSILIFILVLIALILVHEFGHFLAAKWSGMRVDEFGIGFPPRAWGTKVGETEYTINWLPFGGFVKIYGEDPEPGVLPSPRAFSGRPRILQMLVLLAGIAMNLIFAWVLISGTLALGTNRVLTIEEAERAPDAVLAIASVLPGSPAAEAGLAQGDTILTIEGAGGRYAGTNPDLFTAFVGEHEAGLPLTLQVRTFSGEEKNVTVAPRAGVITADPERAVIGVSVAPVGTVKVPWYEAPIEGAVLTWEITKNVAVALVAFFGGLLTLSADLSQVAGPVGIAGAVGDASQTGIVALMTITALISINLALVNLLPLPALDGGRLFFIIIESIIRRPIPVSFTNAVNALGFGFLILLMVLVTASDIFKIVG